MRDPYLYQDADVLINCAGIKDAETLQRAEADITALTMASIYNMRFDKFDADTLLEIHRLIFGQVYPWAGEIRTIQIIKHEPVLGGDTVRYTQPDDIAKELKAVMKEITKLKRDGTNDRDVVFRLTRIIPAIWQLHPFREGNTRTIIVFAVLLANHLGFDVQHELFKRNAHYVRNALVWCTQGMYARYEYLEQIFFDAILHEDAEQESSPDKGEGKYDTINGYDVRDYEPQPHEYKE